MSTAAINCDIKNIELADLGHQGVGRQGIGVSFPLGREPDADNVVAVIHPDGLDEPLRPRRRGARPRRHAAKRRPRLLRLRRRRPRR